MATRHLRQVKLQGKYRPAASSWLSSKEGKEVPWLTVSGLWLERAGFRAGDRVEIRVEGGQLTIKKLAAYGDCRH